MSQRILDLKTGEAVDFVRRIYERNSCLIDEGICEAPPEDLKLHFPRVLFEAARLLPEHVGFHFPPHGGRCFMSAKKLSESIASTSSPRPPETDVEFARWICDLPLARAADLAISKAFGAGPLPPVSRAVEEAYARERFKTEVFDLIWAFLRVTDRGCDNAFLCVASYANAVLDDVNSKEQLFRDVHFHRSTGTLPSGPLFWPLLSLDGLEI